MTAPSLARIIGAAQQRGMGLGDALRAATALDRRGSGWNESGTALHVFDMNRGRVAEAAARATAWRNPIAWADLERQREILEALYWDGDSAAAERAAHELDPIASGAFSRDPERRVTQYHDLCVLEQWRLWHDDARTAAASADRLRTTAVPLHTGRFNGPDAVCVALLDALVARADARAGARALLQRLDSILATGPPYAAPYTEGPLFSAAQYGNLVAARLWAEHGELRRALAAVRRRPNHWFFGPRFLSTFLREEARVAARLGDREAAVRAYRHYLALRDSPEPRLLSDAASARRVLDSLLASR